MRTLRILHRWLALIVGLQLALWTVSGLVFAFLSHADVTGANILRQPPQQVLTKAAQVLEPGALLGEGSEGPVLDAALMPLHQTWVYRLRFPDHVELRNATDGTPFAIGELLVRQLAVARYAGSGSLLSILRREQAGLEVRGAGPVWEAAFDDVDGTRLYFSADDGRFLVARNDTWRLFDFFWMLHTMDYRDRDNFNNPLAILFATGAVWVGISGVLLLFQSFGLTRRLESGPRSRMNTWPG